MDFCKENILPDLFENDENISLVRLVLEVGEDPNLKDFSGQTLLHVAARSSKETKKIVQELINFDADVNKIDCLSYTPLHLAVIFRKRTVVEKLLQSRIQINCQDSFGKSALHYAVNNSHPCTMFRDLPLHAKVPDLWIVRKLLDHKDINVNLKDINGETPLITAVLDKRIKIVNVLLNYDTNLDASHEFGQTLLHMSLSDENPCPYIILSLLLKRVSLFKLNYAYETPLNIILTSKSFHFTCICLKVIVFNYLIKRLLLRKVFKIPILSNFLKSCFNEINTMKHDVIADVLTVFEFFSKTAPKYGFKNPVLNIYKPIVKRLINGLYQEYFCFILHRISKSNLLAVLKVLINEKYCKEDCDDKNCKKKPPTVFSEVCKMSILSDYLSSLDIFCLIVIFSSEKIDKSILNIRLHRCYLTESWEEYPDDYFLLHSQTYSVII